MSDPQNHRSDAVNASDTNMTSDADQTGIGRPVTQADIDDIVNDVHMPIEERMERLQALTAQLGARDEIDSGAEFDPLSAQLSEALNMLAQGGHEYGTVEALEVDPDSGADSSMSDSYGDDGTR